MLNYGKMIKRQKEEKKLKDLRGYLTQRSLKP